MAADLASTDPVLATAAVDSEEVEEEGGMTAAYSMTDLLDGLDDDDDSNMLDPDIESSLEASGKTVVGSVAGKGVTVGNVAGKGDAVDGSGDTRPSVENAGSKSSDGAKDKIGDTTKDITGDKSKDKTVDKSGDKSIEDKPQDTSPEYKDVVVSEGDSMEEGFEDALEEQGCETPEKSDPANDKKEIKTESPETMTKTSEDKTMTKTSDPMTKTSDPMTKTSDPMTKTSDPKTTTSEDKDTTDGDKENELKTEKVQSAQEMKSLDKPVESVQMTESLDKAVESVQMTESLDAAASSIEESIASSCLEDSIQIIVENDVYESADVKPREELYALTETVIQRKRMSPARDSPARDSPVRDSPARDSPARESPEHGLDTVVKADSRETTPDSPGHIRVKSDISGRFHIEGAEQSESVYYNDIPPTDSASTEAPPTDSASTEAPPTSPSSSGHYETCYANVEGAESGRKSMRNYPHHRGGFSGGTLVEGEIYENIGVSTEDAYGDDGGWSSSEFESYDEDDDPEINQSLKRKKEEKPKERRRSARSSMSPDIQLPSMFDKFVAAVSNKSRSIEDEEEEEREEESIRVEEILAKQPLPQLPPQPDNLTTLQVTRRHIVASIVDSERSYTTSLRRIIQEYEKPLLDARPAIVSKRVVRLIFYKVREILHCHNMFQIELAEAVREWDDRQTIGNVFTASFSKSVVFDAYSAFINNFSDAMDATRKVIRNKPQAADFFKQRQASSPDKLSLFGLMVKPVQRFPQFIMFIQDLLHQTPSSHTDRLPLQMALSEVETLTHKLNETKRESESRHDARKVMDNMAGRVTLKHDSNRYMVRQDDMTQVEKTNGQTVTKPRRMILMNDQLVCCSVSHIDDVGMAEKYKFKWCVPIKDVEVIAAPVQPNYQVFSGNGKTTIKTLRAADISVSENNPFRRELDDMLHDLPLIEQMSQMISQLRLKYQGLNLDLMNRVMRTLQIHIQQKSDIDKCILQLAVPVKGNQRVMYVLQVESPAIKQSWLLELSNIKLSLDPRNKPSWQLPESELQYTSRLPLFIQPLLVTVTNFMIDKKNNKKKYNMKITCGTAVVLPSPDLPSSSGLQHVWVVSGDKGRSQVAVVTLSSSSSHGSPAPSSTSPAYQPRVVEAFRCCDDLVLCAETVPSNLPSNQHHGDTLVNEAGAGAGKKKKYVFDGNTVWMGTDEHNIVIFYVEEDQRQECAYKFSVDAKVLCLRYLHHKVYAGLKNGTLLIFTRDQSDGVWSNLKKPLIVKLCKDSPVTCLLTVGRRDMWAGAGQHIHVVTVTTQHGKQDISKVSHEVGSSNDGSIACVARAGSGILVAFSRAPVIRLYHLETMEHLQDVSVQSSVTNMLEGHKLSSTLAAARVSLQVTSLLVSRGLLWVGTNVGCVLTLPLPRLEGIPQMKVRATVSYHAHNGAVTFLLSLHSGICPEADMEKSLLLSSCSGHSVTSGEGGDDAPPPPLQQYEMSSEITDSYEGGGGVITRSADHAVPPPSLLSRSSSRWTSTPCLLSEVAAQESTENVRTLYGSLMQGLNEDDLNDSCHHPADSKHHRRSQNIKAAASAFNAKISQTVSKITGNTASTQQQQQQQKYATLPIVAEDASGGSGGGGREVARRGLGRGGGGGGGDVRRRRRADAEDDGSSAAGDRPGSEVSSISSSYQDDEEQEEEEIDRAIERSGESTGPKPRRKGPSHESFITAVPPHSSVLSQHALSKHVTVISGGAGHINRNAAANDRLAPCDDMCLMLWQSRA